MHLTKLRSVATEIPNIQAALDSTGSRYYLTVDQYHRMAEYGILNEEDRVELLSGQLVPKMPQNPPHAGCVLLTQTKLLSHLQPDCVLRVQSSITLADSEPEPDLVVARGPMRKYMRRHPGARDIGLVVEIADTSLEMDRQVKGVLYAQGRIPVYWIINLSDALIEVYTLPRSGKTPSYRQMQEFGKAGKVPLVLNDSVVAELPVRDLLP
jgi:Uma2 family endonuclease